MNLEEFTAIIDTHGADASRWPESVAGKCESFLQSNDEARDLLAQQQVIDNLMHELEIPDFQYLQTRIQNQTLPSRDASFFDKVVEWLLPPVDINQNLWRPALAACLPIVCGVVLANYFTFGIDLENDGFQYWDDELVMLSFTDIDESGF